MKSFEMTDGFKNVRLKTTSKKARTAYWKKVISDFKGKQLHLTSSETMDLAYEIEDALNANCMRGMWRVYKKFLVHLGLTEIDAVDLLEFLSLNETNEARLRESSKKLKDTLIKLAIGKQFIESAA